MIGSALVSHLREKGHEVVRLLRTASRAPAGEPSVRWDTSGAIDEEGLAAADGIVHLAGENIASRWNVARKASIRHSRVKGTQTLSEGIAAIDDPPRVLVSGSAVGYYGDRGDEILMETKPAGEGFLAEVCQDWEAATISAEKKGVRVVHARIGVVLSTRGGALARMLPPFRLGVGGKVGSGRQYMSWIAIDDVVAVILRALEDETIAGPVNIVSPNPVTNREFTKTLGSVLSRPTVLPMPAFAARMAFGEMGRELLLSSGRVMPEVLRKVGYEFRFPELAGALRHLLQK